MNNKKTHTNDVTDQAPMEGHGLLCPKKHSIPYKTIAITLLLVISLMINIYSFLRPGPLVAIIKKSVIKQDNSIFYFITGLDKFLINKVPKGNLFLKFKGYGALDKESDSDLPLLIYMRAYYTLYPRETFVVKPGVVVNKGEDIMKNPFDPDTEWLKKHGVTKVVTIINNQENGNTEFDIQSVK